MRRGPVVGAVVIAASGFLGSQLQAIAASPGTSSISHHSGLVGLVANPTVDFVLLLVALLGVGLEVVHPGSFIFGTVGLVAGALAVLGLANQPVDLVGLFLVGSAAALLVIDTAVQGHGVIGLGGVLAAVLGGLVLFNSGSGDGGVSLIALITVPVVIGATWITLSRRALRVRRLPYASSSHELLGLTAVVRERADPTGIAAVDGELWRVTSRHGEPIEVGNPVEVMAQDGLTLIVDPLPGLMTASDKVATPGANAGARLG